jgi:hypothetical protein
VPHTPVSVLAALTVCRKLIFAFLSPQRDLHRRRVICVSRAGSPTNSVSSHRYRRIRLDPEHRSRSLLRPDREPAWDLDERVPLDHGRPYGKGRRADALGTSALGTSSTRLRLFP